MITYTLVYHYYQYNSGAADNGYYKKTLIFKEQQLNEVMELAKKIKLSIARRSEEEARYESDDNSEWNFELSEDDNRELIQQLLPYDGYFTKCQLIKSVIEQSIVNI